MQTKLDHPALVALFATADLALALALAASGRTPLRAVKREITLRGWWQVIRRTAIQISYNGLMTDGTPLTRSTRL